MCGSRVPSDYPPFFFSSIIAPRSCRLVYLPMRCSVVCPPPLLSLTLCYVPVDPLSCRRVCNVFVILAEQFYWERSLKLSNNLCARFSYEHMAPLDASLEMCASDEANGDQDKHARGYKCCQGSKSLIRPRSSALWMNRTGPLVKVR